MTNPLESQTIPRTNRILSLLVFLLISTFLLQAETISGLGTATFPTSTHSAAAQRDFIRGLLLLHLFEYSDAAKSFGAAEKTDPGFAMAYWGEAMTFNHPVWDELDVGAGQAALAKFGATPEARFRRIDDPRERAFMSAVEILYSGQGTKQERDAQYATAMQRLSEAYPKDDETQLFYALALLGKSEGVRDVPTYLQAAAIAKAVFMRSPDHPGAAHYWIHGMDDPQHAEGAIVAARALSKIAPEAAHAQHMCSHIFLALGMWDGVVEANVAATSVVNRQAGEAGKPPRRCGHYSFWLEYGYLEQGRIGDAKKVVAGCRAEAMESMMAARARGTVDPDNASVESFVVMRSRYLVDTGLWHGEVAGWSVDMGGALMPEFIHAFGTGFAAAEDGNLPAAQESLATLDRILPQLPAVFDQEALPAGDPERPVPGIQRLQLQAAILDAESHTDQGVAAMQQAVEAGKNLPYAFGPPEPAKPSYELLGELLLKEHEAPQAREAFEASLKRAPRRTESLLGLARAENAMGDKAAATDTYRELLEIWKNADLDYAPEEEARRNVSVPSRAAN
jgi:tetratricopeptide (TPR) repeat protein